MRREKNYKIKLDLTKLKGAKIANSKTQGKVLAIPIGKDGLFFSEKTGAVYLQLKAIANPQRWQSHSIKQFINQAEGDVYCGSMNEESYYGKRKRYYNDQGQQEDYYEFNVDGLAI